MVTSDWMRAALAALLLFGGASVAQAAPTGSGPEPEIEGVAITPAKVEEDLGSRRATYITTIVNHGATPHEVDLAVAELAHDLSGVPVFGTGEDSGFHLLGPTSLTLAPGQSVDVEVAVAFPDDVAAYGGLIATLDPSTATRGDIGVANRVASLFLVRGPQPWDQTLELREAGTELSADGTSALLLLDLANVGDAHVRPSGSVTVRQDGTVLAVLPLIGQNVLPGSARRHRVSWVPPGDLKGAVELTVDLDDGSRWVRTVGLADIAERVAREREVRNLPPSGAVLQGVPLQGPARLGRLWWPLIVALGLLIIAAIWLWIVWRRSRDQRAEMLAAEAERRPPSPGDGEHSRVSVGKTDTHP